MSDKMMYHCARCGAAPQTMHFVDEWHLCQTCVVKIVRDFFKKNKPR